MWVYNWKECSQMEIDGIEIYFYAHPIIKIIIMYFNLKCLTIIVNALLLCKKNSSENPGITFLKMSRV